MPTSANPPAEASVGDWQIYAATARGTVHDSMGLPNQDASRHHHQQPDGPSVAAVADGHGHDRHFRSATGSAEAVRVACDAALDWAQAQAAQAQAQQPAGDADDAGQLLAAAQARLVPDILRRWHAAVDADLALRPYTVDERQRMARHRDGPSVPYGSTLLLAVVVRRWMVFVQIGDGDIVVIRPDGQCRTPLPPDGPQANWLTRSLCEPDALADFRVAVHDLAGPRGRSERART